jgi:fermentation-respiration switch protein FrsA (DUF1100 family)
LKLLILTAVLAYAGIVVLVWAVQERLLFYPPSASPRPQAPQGWRLEEVSFTTQDGTRLSGFLALPPREKPPVVIYFGGNAEEVTAYVPQARENYGERAVLFVNYRGYGASGGKPAEKSIVADGVELFDWVSKRPELDGARVAVHGRSLGTGVAVQVAAARATRCVVLTSPFASALGVASEIYWWLPVRLLMRHPFDSIARAPQLHMPLLVLTGEADDLIPVRHSQALASAWGGAVEKLSLPGYGHNDLQLDPRYAATLRAFLDAHL